MKSALPKGGNLMEDQLSTTGVGFLGMLIIGIIAGWIAEKVTASDHGLLTNLLVGIAGSFVGGWLAQLMNIQFNGWVGNLSWRRSARFLCCGCGGSRRHVQPCSQR
jgi:uncharacterized membrane protein YeaQ/YmgE (transglycosylase-associated protein family)